MKQRKWLVENKVDFSQFVEENEFQSIIKKMDLYKRTDTEMRIKAVECECYY